MSVDEAIYEKTQDAVSSLSKDFYNPEAPLIPDLEGRSSQPQS